MIELTVSPDWMVAAMAQLLAKLLVGCVMAGAPLGRVAMAAVAPMVTSPKSTTIGTPAGRGGAGLGGGGGSGEGEGEGVAACAWA